MGRECRESSVLMSLLQSWEGERYACQAVKGSGSLCEWPEGFTLLDSCGHSTGTSLLEAGLLSPSGGIMTGGMAKEV